MAQIFVTAAAREMDSVSGSGTRQTEWLRLATGVAACAAIAAVAEAAGHVAPLIGAPVFAILIGVVAANALAQWDITSRLRIRHISGWALRGGIVLLGATLDLRDVAQVGVSSLLLLAITITAGLLVALAVGRWIGVEWRLRCLIGIGTTICGASAIAALAPVVRAKTADIAYAISVIFLFNMLAVVTFPMIGHAVGLSDSGFGLWAGTAVNDTSAVVAAGFAFSKAAGTYATIVKLTRTTFIIPLTLGFGLLTPWLEERDGISGRMLLGRLRQAVPWFIGLFVIASLMNTAGLVGSAAPMLQDVARFVLVLAMAAVGLQGHWRSFAGAGLRPVIIGLGAWAAVALASLAVQAWTVQL